MPKPLRDQIIELGGAYTITRLLDPNHLHLVVVDTKQRMTVLDMMGKTTELDLMLERAIRILEVNRGQDSDTEAG